MAIIIYPRHGIWYIAWVGISNPIPVDGAVTVRAYPLYVKQEDFSDITATAKLQFRDKYAREGYQLQKILQLRPTSTHTMAGDTMKLFSTRDRVVVMCWLSAYMRTGRAMTMFYAGTPITCIWCDKSCYMTSHVVLVVITTFWIWPLPDILRQVRARSIDSIHIGYSFCDQCDK